MTVMRLEKIVILYECTFARLACRDLWLVLMVLNRPHPHCPHLGPWISSSYQNSCGLLSVLW